MTIAIIFVKPRFRQRLATCAFPKKKLPKTAREFSKAAARLIRERGISGAGVDALTEAAGMTHGSLYSQFGSKERLIEEALDARGGQRQAGDGGARRRSLRTLRIICPVQHRDSPGSGCPSPPSCSEMPRQSKQRTPARLPSGLRGMIDATERPNEPGAETDVSAMKRRLRWSRHLSVHSSFPGPWTDPKLSDDILRATKIGLGS